MCTPDNIVQPRDQRLLLNITKPFVYAVRERCSFITLASSQQAFLITSTGVLSIDTQKVLSSWQSNWWSHPFPLEIDCFNTPSRVLVEQHILVNKITASGEKKLSNIVLMSPVLSFIQPKKASWQKTETHTWNTTICKSTHTNTASVWLTTGGSVA